MGLGSFSFFLSVSLLKEKKNHNQVLLLGFFAMVGLATDYPSAFLR